MDLKLSEAGWTLGQSMLDFVCGRCVCKLSWTLELDQINETKTTVRAPIEYHHRVHHGLLLTG